MNNTNVPVIAIIGGGFSGLMTAVHLSKKSHVPIKIIIINNGYPFGKGVAYSAHTEKYLLNVRAINMSAFPDEKEHFLNWVCSHEKYKVIGKTIMTNVYMPRQKYGEYLNEIWQETLQNKKEFVEIETISSTAVDIVPDNAMYKIVFENAEKRMADFVVLATGNSQPAALLKNEEAFAENKNYFPNPWTPSSVADAKNLKNVLIVGNGLTMIDTVLGLWENGFKGTIYTVSPKGFTLLPHKYNLLEYHNVVQELPEKYDLYSLLSLVNKHAKRLVSVGIGVHLIIDALRPYTQKIWQSLSIREKKIFLKKLSYPWNSLRHRVPMHIYEQILAHIHRQKLIPLKGRVKEMKEHEEGLCVIISGEVNKAEEIIFVQRVINCTGPHQNIKKSDNILIRNLAEKKFILPDELAFGIAADPVTGAILNEDGAANEHVYTLGNNLKGVLWESVAVPELRVQAQNLAITILDKSGMLFLQNLSALRKSVEYNYIE